MGGQWSDKSMGLEDKKVLGEMLFLTINSNKLSVNSSAKNIIYLYNTFIL